MARESYLPNDSGILIPAEMATPAKPTLLQEFIKLKKETQAHAEACALSGHMGSAVEARNLVRKLEQDIAEIEAAQ